MAVANYESAHGKLPSRASASGLSWRVELLPYIEEKKLHDSIDHSSAWDSEVNAKFHRSIPHGLKCHNREDKSPDTQMFAVHASNSCWRDGETHYEDILDRHTDTLMFIELDLPSVNWMSPVDISLDELVAILERDGQLPTTHPAGVLMAFADVSVRCVPHEKITPKFLRAIVSMDGAEEVDSY